MLIRSRRLVVGVVVGALVACALAAVVAVRATRAGALTPTAIIGRRVLGHSVQGRAIVAYHLGDPSIRRVSVLLGQMHGDEHAGVTLTRSLINGTRAVEGINLWVVPSLNPDGDAAHTRQNAHHVDLNRNWPDHWAHLTGRYYAGRKPGSEPETQAMYRFLRQVKPHYLLSLHQPLHGVDTTDGGALDAAFRSRLVHNLGLPAKPFRCWSVCHGSMTGWYTTHRYGIGETVEFGSHPSHYYLTHRARWAVVRSMGGHFGPLGAHNPRVSLRLRAWGGHIHFYGYAFDPDARWWPVLLGVWLDGHLVRRLRAADSTPIVDRRYHLTGGHGARPVLAAGPGRHQICVFYRNVRAGTANTRRCLSVVVPADAPARTRPTPVRPATSSTPPPAPPSAPSSAPTSSAATAATSTVPASPPVVASSGPADPSETSTTAASTSP